MSKIQNINTSTLVKLASENSLTITPNNRIAANLTSYTVNFILNETCKSACLTPTILPLKQWIADTFNTLRINNVAPFSKLALVTESALASYWVRAMYSQGQSDNLINPSEWLREAMAADKIAARWKLVNYTPDSALSNHFKKWRKQVQKELLSNGYVTEAMAIELVISAIKNGELSLPKNVYTFAFDEIPPLYQDLFDAITNHANLSELKPLRSKAKWYRVETLCSEDQFKVAAKWASKVIENEKGKSIAIVSPDLKSQKKDIIKSLNDVFEPQWVLPESGSYTAPYDVSLGEPLNQIPLFNRALYYLSLENVVMSEEVINIINDPFAFANKEKMERRRFAKKMRDNRGIKTALKSLAMKSSCPPFLSKSLNDFANLSEALNTNSMVPSKWAMAFNDMLSVIGWAKNVELNELELLGAKKWVDALDMLAALDTHTGTITKELALRLINQYTANTLVTPQTKGSPINVLGALEAAGLDFDYVWVLDCNNNVFPAKAEPNACLPHALQIESKTPHSSGEREHEFTNQLFSRYSTSCDELYTSYITEDQYGSKEAAFILTEATADIDADSIIDHDLICYKEASFQRFSTHTVNNEIGPLATNNNTIPGGVAVLDLMNLCPMQAITNNRLKVGEHKPNFTMGLFGGERGEMMHNALEAMWGEIIELAKAQKSPTHSDQLHLMEPVDVQSMIERAVDSAFFWLDRDDISDELIEQERKQMSSTLTQWIEIEKARDKFNVIAMEKSDFVILGDFKIKIRKDRLDSVVNSANINKTLALDYKSSEESCTSALSRKIDKSQLPLAALSEGANGVGYLNVVPYSSNISGLADDESLEMFKPIGKHRAQAPKEWQELTGWWRDTLAERVKQYAQGFVSFTPSAKACAYCVKRSLCEHSAA
ncbi:MULTISPECIES: PD-(D/E)XK nuclease family protein [Pseudoalteromonas]|uniref:PD-(D/E)XK nuclease family protein n=1 Tax=Pseudoalteromonas TaxID=53246 RepID=UPI001581BC66|nr:MULTISPECIES: PD-(D/E)XK nuclease family protein [Pseudoalteromonas]MDI4654585.1 PD-(D/E)XK nuclease family protein [Pseudoalteromonas shioyasakiensis]NUJ40146.1 PD-(D/E)XK nuclease family protein [Pseudoalteromonas sp. 0303]